MTEYDSGNRMRRTGLATLAGALVALATREALADGGRLLVFLHVAVKQRALQSAIQGGVEGVTVTAVGRIGDLERGLQEGQDAVLTLPAVLASKNLSAKLQGVQKGAADEPYCLVAVDHAPNPTEVKSVGALDLLGREGTNAFVAGLLGAQPKVERVTKVEDLLPLLQMQVVEAVLLPSRFLAEVRAASRLELAPTELSKRVGLPAVASVGPAGDQVIAAISKMPPGTLKGIGVDAWR